MICGACSVRVFVGRGAGGLPRSAGVAVNGTQSRSARKKRLEKKICKATKNSGTFVAEGNYTVNHCLSQLPFGLGTIRDATNPEALPRLESGESQLPFGLGTIRDAANFGNCVAQLDRSQLPFGLGTIRDGVLDYGKDIEKAVSIAFRLGNDSGRARVPRRGHVRALVSIAFRLGNDSGHLSRYVGVNLPHRRVSIAFRLGNDSGRGDNSDGIDTTQMSQLPFGLGTIRDDEALVYFDDRDESQLPFGLGTIRDSGSQQAWDQFVASQLPFGLGTIRDGVLDYGKDIEKAVSIAFRLGNDSGRARVPRRGHVRALVSIAFRLGNDSGQRLARLHRQGRPSLNCLSAWERFGTQQAVEKRAP